MRKYLNIWALCLMCTVPVANAAEDTVETGAVKVTASKIEQELKDVSASVSVITEDDIKKSSAKTIAELLQDIQGVQITSSGSQGLKRVSIRGESSNRSLVLIDGQKIAENKSMDGAALLIDPSMVERIEIIRGPGSVLYGSDAIGGVINIITKKGGKKILQGDLSLAYNGSGNGFAEYGSLYGAAAGLEYRLSVSNEDQRTLLTPEGATPHTNFGQQNYGAYLAYNINNDFKVGGGYDYFKAHIKAGSMEQGYENFYVDIPEWTRQKAFAFAEMKNITPFMPTLRLDAFWQENRKKMVNHVEVVGMPMVLDNKADNTNNQIGLALQSDWMVQEHTYIVAGYDFSYSTLSADTDQDTSSSRPLPVFNYLKTFFHKGHEYTHALYAQGESSLPLDFTLNYGVRWTHVSTEMTDATGSHFIKTTGTTTELGPDQVGSEGTSYGNAPVFAAGVMWQGIEPLTLRFNFSQGFRTPSLQERYIVSSMGGGVIIPEPNLKAETSNNFELGARYDYYGLSVDAVYFWSLADDYIATITVDPATSTTRYVNVSSAYTHGAELALSYEFFFGLKPYTTLTYMERKYDSGTSSTWMTGIPKLYGRAGLSYRHEFSSSIEFFTDIYARFSSDTKSLSGSEVISYHAWTTANAAMGINFGNKKQYGLHAEILNIFNETYQIEGSIYEPALHAALKFSAGF